MDQSTDENRIVEQGRVVLKMWVASMMKSKCASLASLVTKIQIRKSIAGAKAQNLADIKLNDAVNSGCGSSRLHYHLVRYSQEYHVRISSILGRYSLLEPALPGCIFGSGAVFLHSPLRPREKA